jgi:4-amino-4-deoxy-L-arabinose transferase-like glycosyltransferase
MSVATSRPPGRGTAEEDSASRPRPARRLGRLVRRLPAACWACAAIAAVNAAVWAMIIPPFQVPDEIDHSAYVQYVAEKGDLPRPSGRAPDYAANLVDAAGAMPFSVEGKPNWSATSSRVVHDRLPGTTSTPGEVGVGAGAVNNPPLYYVLGAVPYLATSGADYFDTLLAMRLLSALLAGIAVLFVFLFLREVLPGTRWAWSVGALVVAFQPLFGFMSGGVNNDSLVYAAGAALLYVVARAFRRGLTPRLGIALGAVFFVGLMAKSHFLAFVPGVLLAGGLLVWRAAPERRRAALTGLGLAGAMAAIPFGLWMIINQQVFDRVATTTGGFTAAPIEQATTVSGQLSYMWQYFLPRAPFLSDQFTDYPLWDTYFQGFVGRLGWFQYQFPMWVNWTALGVVAVLIVLAALALSRAHLLRSGRWAEVLTYATLLGGLLLLVNIAGYRFRTTHFIGFEQTRYLFPMLGLWGLFVAVAARGAGRRWAPAVGGVLVVLAMAHSLFAMLLTVSRYYA